MNIANTCRSVAFAALGLALSSVQAFAQSPGVPTGAVNDFVSGITIDGTFTGNEWSGVRPLAFKLDETTGGVFSTVPEDPAADNLVYVAPGPSTLYFMYDVPALANTTPPSAGQVLFSLTLPRASGATTVSFVAVGGGTYGVTFQGPSVNGLVGAGQWFVPAPNQDGIAHYRFELAAPLSDLQNLGDQAIWRSTQPVGLAQRDLSRLETLVEIPGPVTAFAQTPLAANSVTLYVRDTLQGLRSRLTRREHVSKLNEAVAKLSKAVGPALYVDQGHLAPHRGEKVFHFDMEAVSSLFELLRKLDLAPMDFNEFPPCRADEPADGIRDPIVGCAQILFGVTSELAVSAKLELQQQNPGSPAAAAAQVLLDEGDEDWRASEPEGIRDYGQAWELVTP